MHAARAVFTDFAPDFEVGVRGHYQYSKHFKGIYQVTNGWQIIKENNNTPAFGMAHVYEKRDKFLFNWGVFAGNEPFQGRMEQFRLYNNLFAKIQTGMFTLAPMFDIGFQNDSLQKKQWWHAYGMSLRYQLPGRFAVAARYEFMNDKHSIIPETNTHLLGGFKMSGYTITFEYLPTSNTTIRLEGKYAHEQDPVFPRRDGFSKDDVYILVSIASMINRKF